MARPAPAASRAVDILDFLTANPGRGYSLSQLAKQLSMNLASAHAVLGVLESSGYVVRHPNLRTYTLGPVLVAAGTAALEQHPALEAARGEISRLSREAAHELVVTTIAGDHVVALARDGPRHPQGLEVGRRLPFAPPVGAVFVAWSDDDDVEQWYARSPAGRPADADHWRTVLSTIRDLGYQIALKVNPGPPIAEWVGGVLADHGNTVPLTTSRNVLEELGKATFHVELLDMSSEYRVNTIAAPIFDAGGRVSLSIVMFGFPDSMPATDLVAYGERLRDAALVITRRTRGVVPVVRHS